MTTILFVAGFLFLALDVGVLLCAARRSHEGYEDEAGFHHGREPVPAARTSKRRAANATQACLLN